MMDVISNKEVIEILYDFIKTQITILDLSKFDVDSNPQIKEFVDITQKVQNEIKINKNKDDIKIQMLDEMLQQVFEKLKISDLDDIGDMTEELKEALKKAKEINDKNEELSNDYGGNYAFVKTYQDTIQENENINKADIEKALKIIYEEIAVFYNRDIF